MRAFFIFDSLLLPKDYLNEVKVIPEVIHPFVFDNALLTPCTCTRLPLLSFAFLSPLVVHLLYPYYLR